MIPAPLLPPVAILIAVNVAMWCSSVERRPAGRYVTIDGRRVPFAE
jgi:hypothetical protein